jgi:hypothetical protein
MQPKWLYEVHHQFESMGFFYSLGFVIDVFVPRILIARGMYHLAVAGDVTMAIKHFCK